MKTESLFDNKDVLSYETDDFVFTEDSISSTNGNTCTNGSNFQKDSNL